jgi:hypothetical protein
VRRCFESVVYEEFVSITYQREKNIPEKNVAEEAVMQTIENKMLIWGGGLVTASQAKLLFVLHSRVSCSSDVIISIIAKSLFSDEVMYRNIFHFISL